jgi:hypothetical protein
MRSGNLRTPTAGVPTFPRRFSARKEKNEDRTEKHSADGIFVKFRDLLRQQFSQVDSQHEKEEERQACNERNRREESLKERMLTKVELGQTLPRA